MIYSQRVFQTSMCSRHVIVIGAGPAGLMAAITAGRLGAGVTILERMQEPGLKLLATGGGRCNFTCMTTPEDYAAALGRSGRFVTPAYKSMTPDALRGWFASIGVDSFVEERVRVYPVSGKARDVRDRLVAEARRLGVRIVTRVNVSELCIKDGRVVGVMTDDHPAHEYVADAVILTPGGCAWPSLGSNGSGFDLARQAGHAIVNPVPALTPLTTLESWPADVAGVSLPAVELVIKAHGVPSGVRRGAILFTHRGLSGPVVLNASGDVSRAWGAGERVRLLLQGLVPQLEILETNAFWGNGRTSVVGCLQKFMPRSLAGALCGRAEISEHVSGGQVAAKARARLETMLRTGVPLQVAGTGGFENAMVTRGGVRLQEVDPVTLRSRKQRGLFLAGEILDLDGPCGGYNLHWAFCSGCLAGKRAATEG